MRRSPSLYLVIILIGLFLFLPYHSQADSVFHITSEYPGGNIIVDKIDGDTVHIRQDLRDTETWWFYWNFKVSTDLGNTMHFQFEGKSPIGVHGPAFSLDNGATWAWLGSESVDGSTFSYTFPKNNTEVQFAFSIPYQESNLASFLSNQSAKRFISTETLCTSKKGRDVERIRVGCINQEPRFRVLLTARHHACESIASFTMEGILAEALSDSATGQWLQENVEIMAIPFVDKDGVEDGDQGKRRRPRDHNRDYIGEAIHPEVAALREQIPKWSDGKLLITLDLHCPHIRGKHNEDIYIVGNADPAIAKEQHLFSELLESLNTDALPYHESNNLLFGQAWNTNANYSQGKSFSRWGGEQPGVILSGTFEIPYANASGTVVTAENARAFGHSIAKTIKAYLMSKDS